MSNYIPTLRALSVINLFNHSQDVTVGKKVEQAFAPTYDEVAYNCLQDLINYLSESQRSLDSNDQIQILSLLDCLANYSLVKTAMMIHYTSLFKNLSRCHHEFAKKDEIRNYVTMCLQETAATQQHDLCLFLFRLFSNNLCKDDDNLMQVPLKLCAYEENKSLTDAQKSEQQSTRLKLLSYLLKYFERQITTRSLGFAMLENAVSKNHLEIVSLLITERPDLQNLLSTSVIGATPLLNTAARNGHLEAVELLVANNAPLNHSDQSGVTPLHEATAEGHSAIVAFLLKQPGIIVDSVIPNNGMTPLLFAVFYNDLLIAELLLKKNVNINHRNLREMTAVMYASNNLEMLKLLDTYHPQYDLHNNDTKSALDLARTHGNRETVQFLEDKGLTSDEPLQIKDTAPTAPSNAFSKTKASLSLASLMDEVASFTTLENQLELISLLPILREWKTGPLHAPLTDFLDRIPRSPTVTAQQALVIRFIGQSLGLSIHSPEFFPLFLTLFKSSGIGQEETFSVLRLLCSQADTQHNEEMIEMILTTFPEFAISQPFIHFASSKGYLKIVKLLVETYHIPVDQTDSRKETALHHAAQNEQLEIMRYLIDKEANIDAQGKGGITPLHTAAEGGHIAALKLLLEKEAKITMGTKKFQRRRYLGNALHGAARLGLKDTVEFLFNTGKFDINTKTNSGKTPLTLVLRHYHGSPQDPSNKPYLDTVKFLVNNEAQIEKHHLNAAIAASDTLAEWLLSLNKVEIDESHLQTAARVGGLQILKLVLEKKPELKIGVETLKLGAQCNDKSKTLQYLLPLMDKSNKDAYEDALKAALYAAVAAGRVEATKLLIKEGVQVSSCPDLIDGIFIANCFAKLIVPPDAATRYLSCFELLLDNGFSPNTLLCEGTLTPLHAIVAIHNDNEHAKTGIDFLLGRMANINAQNIAGNTPLHLAVSQLNQYLVEYLVSKDAKLDIANREGLTPLATAESLEETFMQAENGTVPVEEVNAMSDEVKALFKQRMRDIISMLGWKEKILAYREGTLQ